MAANDKKPITDISKPGESPADATARPIITGHAIMKDPMVNGEPGTKPASTEEETVVEPDKKEPVAPSAAHKVIKPLESTEDKKDKTDDQTTEASEKTSDGDAKSETPEEDGSASDDAVVDAVLEQVGDKQQETKLSEEERKRQELVDKLVQEKKYFLPINQTRSRRNNRRVLLVLAALLPVVVGLGLAAKMGMLKLPNNFMKAKPTQSTVSQSPAPTTTPAVPIAAMQGLPDADTVKWTKVTSGLKGLAVKIPDGWQVTNYQKQNLISGDSIVFTSGKAATVNTADTSANDAQQRFEVVQFKNTDSFKFINGDEQKQDFASGTLKGTRYYKQYPVTAPQALGPDPGTEVYTYEFKTKQTTTYVIYSIRHTNQYSKANGITKDDPNQLDIVEKLVRTLQITQ